MRQIVFNNVDLPQPLAPINAVTLPSGIVRFKFSIIFVSP